MIYLLVECSECDAIYKTPQGTRQELWHNAKQQGWSLGIRGQHYCPSCTVARTADFPKAVQS